MDRYRLIVTAVVFGSLSLPSGAHAQRHCDTTVPVSQQYAFHYKERGAPARNDDRCEGIYVQEVSSTALQLASFALLFEEYDPDEDEYLLVTWEAPERRAVRLLGHGLRHSLFYRMDTTRPADSTTFRWPVSILSSHGVRRDHLGVLGWIARQAGQRIYLPLRITRRETEQQPDHYQVRLMPGQELHEVFWSMAPVDDELNPEAFLVEEQPLGYGYYPARQAIDLDLPLAQLPAPGIYYVELVARFRRGGSATAEFWFYHPPASP